MHLLIIFGNNDHYWSSREINYFVGMQFQK